MTISVKICGITTAEAAIAAARHGAAYVGLVFFPRSPRFVSDALAREIAQETPKPAKRIGLFVDPFDRDLEATLDCVPLDLIQLHGHESPERVAEIKARYRLPVMKALRVANAADLAVARDYEAAADWLLFDAPPPEGADRPGGNGMAFDWSLLAGRAWKKPWMLSGGLDAANVAQAIRVSGARAVDVSSGVESRPGLKDATLIENFLAAATMRP